MLKKQYRLTKRKSFNYIYRVGKIKSGENIIINYTPTKLNNCKVGFSVSKKIGKAHLRNKIKRQLREAVKNLLPRLNQKHNYIISAKPSIIDKSFNKISEELFQILNKCGMIVNE